MISIQTKERVKWEEDKMELQKTIEEQDEEADTRIEEIEEVAKEYDSNLGKQIKINNSIEACNQYNKKVLL